MTRWQQMLVLVLILAAVILLSAMVMKGNIDGFP